MDLIRVDIFISQTNFLEDQRESSLCYGFFFFKIPSRIIKKSPGGLLFWIKCGTHFWQIQHFPADNSVASSFVIQYSVKTTHSTSIDQAV